MKTLGFKFLLTRCLQQDPLENFFGIIRGLCGQNFRPTCVQFTASYKTCLINNLVSNSYLTNCENDETDFLISFLKPPPLSASLPLAVPIQYSNEPSTSFTTQTESIPKILYSMKFHTSSYIAGFICKKFLKKDCPRCTSFFLGSKCTDIHSLIIIKQYGTMHYPSQKFIDSINKLKAIIFKLFFENINSTNIFSAIEKKLNYVSDCCSNHNLQNTKMIKDSIIFIMVRYIITLINRKMTLKDRRPNATIDNYLKRHGSIVYKK